MPTLCIPSLLFGTVHFISNSSCMSILINNRSDNAFNWWVQQLISEETLYRAKAVVSTAREHEFGLPLQRGTKCAYNRAGVHALEITPLYCVDEIPLVPYVMKHYVVIVGHVLLFSSHNFSLIIKKQSISQTCRDFFCVL